MTDPKESASDKMEEKDHPEDDNLEKDVIEEFAGFCSDSYLRARGGCCRMILTVDEFLPETEKRRDDMKIDTHQGIDAHLCGKPIHLAEGESRVELETLPAMAVDETGLIHGGFIFGLADYAAMIAVNHPNVVLGSASVRFLKPVVTGDKVVAEAKVDSVKGKKNIVNVKVHRVDEVVFEGEFTCFVLDKHILK